MKCYIKKAEQASGLARKKSELKVQEENKLDISSDEGDEFDSNAGKRIYKRFENRKRR